MKDKEKNIFEFPHKEYEVIESPTEHKINIQTPEGELITEIGLLERISNQIKFIKNEK